MNFSQITAADIKKRIKRELIEGKYNARSNNVRKFDRYSEDSLKPHFRKLHNVQKAKPLVLKRIVTKQRANTSADTQKLTKTIEKYSSGLEPGNLNKPEADGEKHKSEHNDDGAFEPGEWWDQNDDYQPEGNHKDGIPPAKIVGGGVAHDENGDDMKADEDPDKVDDENKQKEEKSVEKNDVDTYFKFVDLGSSIKHRLSKIKEEFPDLEESKLKTMKYMEFSDVFDYHYYYARSKMPDPKYHKLIKDKMITELDKLDIPTGQYHKTSFYYHAPAELPVEYIDYIVLAYRDQDVQGKNEVENYIKLKVPPELRAAASEFSVRCRKIIHARHNGIVKVGVSPVLQEIEQDFKDGTNLIQSELKNRSNKEVGNTWKESDIGAPLTAHQHLVLMRKSSGKGYEIMNRAEATNKFAAIMDDDPGISAGDSAKVKKTKQAEKEKEKNAAFARATKFMKDVKCGQWTTGKSSKWTDYDVMAIPRNMLYGITVGDREKIKKDYGAGKNHIVKLNNLKDITKFKWTDAQEEEEQEEV